MKMVVALIALAILTPSAFGQTIADCGSIKDGKQRLACYDKMSRQSHTAPSKAETPALNRPYSEQTAKEDAKMKAVLKPICKNC